MTDINVKLNWGTASVIGLLILFLLPTVLVVLLVCVPLAAIVLAGAWIANRFSAWRRRRRRLRRVAL